MAPYDERKREQTTVGFDGGLKHWRNHVRAVLDIVAHDIQGVMNRYRKWAVKKASFHSLRKRFTKAMVDDERRQAESIRRCIRWEKAHKAISVCSGIKGKLFSVYTDGTRRESERIVN